MRFLLLPVMALLSALAAPAIAADIDIKGFRLGMTRDELTAAGAVESPYGEVSIPGFTIGGAPERFGKATLLVEDNKLVGLMFFFYSSWFDEVAEAVRAKYPKAQCRNEAMQNGYGARFTNTSCLVDDGKTLLTVHRYLDDTETGSLSLKPRPLAAAKVEQSRKRKADI